MDDLAQSIDQKHLAFQYLLPHIQDLVWELPKVKREIMTGAKYNGMELEQIEYQHRTGGSRNKRAARGAQKGQW